MTIQMNHTSTLKDEAVTTSEFRENLVKKKMITPVAAPLKIHRRKFWTLISLLENLVGLSHVVEMRVELLQQLVLLEDLFVEDVGAVGAGPLFVVDVLVENRSDDQRPGSEDQVVETDVEVVVNGLAAERIVEAEDELGEGEDDVLVEEVLDHFGNTDVGPSAMDEQQFPERLELN